MPRGDRTGPMGAGPMTGRRAGYCAGSDMPGYANANLDARGGMWSGRGPGGRGRGWRHCFFAIGLPGWRRMGYAPLTSEQELTGLKEEANWLKNRLDMINQHIEELGKKEQK